MGQGLSGEDDTGQERSPPNEMYLHWLLSDPTRIEEAFKPVWRACCSDEQGTAPKDAVLQVMLRVVAELERTAEIGGRPAPTSAKTPRQLTRVVGMLPEQLSRTEVLQLFRTALLSVQSALVGLLVNDVPIDWPLGAAVPPGFPGSGAGPPGDFPSDALQSASGSPGGQPPNSPLLRGVTGSPSPDGWRYGSAGMPRSGFGALSMAAASGSMDLVPSSRANTQAEDPTPKVRVMRMHPAVKAAQLSPAGSLPSREELDVENVLLQELTEVVEASARDELAVVRALEEEIRTSEGDRPQRLRGSSSGNDDALLRALEAKADATAEEISQLESKVKAHDGELTESEVEVAVQQREIQMLLSRRGEEEASADRLSREARDLTLELKSCRRTCGSLENEIASEEARASALRQAFEGRRARFTTAETAARNAELSTMRATRRRTAAEATAHREASAVEEAESARSKIALHSEEKVKVLLAEINEVRQFGASENKAGRRTIVTAQAASEAEQSLVSLRTQLQHAEQEHDSEVRSSQASANEVAELEVSRARLEGQLAGRESELNAVQQRGSRPDASVGADAATGRKSAMAPAGDDDREVGHVNAAIQAVEMRIARAKQREAEMHTELRALVASRSFELRPSGGAMDAEEELAVVAAWQRAREVGAELGEAHAALARRQAQDESAGGSEVVAALKVTLKGAEEQEAWRCAELTEACDRLTASLAEQNGLRLKLSNLSEVHSSEVRGASAGAGTATFSRVSALGPQRVEAGMQSGAMARGFGGGTALGLGAKIPETQTLAEQVQALERELGHRGSILERKLEDISPLQMGVPLCSENPPPSSGNMGVAGASGAALLQMQGMI